MELIEKIVTIYNNYDYETEVLVASVRNPTHVVDAAMIGADICTIPFSVMQQLVKHPLTDVGLKKFVEDAKKIPKRDRCKMKSPWVTSTATRRPSRSTSTSSS